MLMPKSTGGEPLPQPHDLMGRWSRGELMIPDFDAKKRQQDKLVWFTNLGDTERAAVENERRAESRRVKHTPVVASQPS